MSSLKQMMELAEEWDAKYNALRQGEKSDGKKLAATLKEAQHLCIKTPTMIAALLDMKQNSSWINES